MKLERFPLGALWTNCYVVSSDTGEAVVIDPGGPAEDVARYIEKEKLKVEWILLTHGHGDHIGGIDDLRGLSRQGIAVNDGDADCLTSSSQNLSGHMGQPVDFPPADRILKDGEDIRVGGMNIRVIHTPGHTRGGCCFHFTEGEDALLISGDTLFARSIGRTDLPGGSEETLMKSLEKLNFLPDSLPVYPGHGPDTTIGEERRLNPFWPRG